MSPEAGICLRAQLCRAYETCRERKAFETNKPPAMRVRVEGYTKKGTLFVTIELFKPYCN